METPIVPNRSVAKCSRIKKERKAKLKCECVMKKFDRYLKKGILVYLIHRSLPKIISENCTGCSFDDPSQKHHDCLMRPYSEWIYLKFEEMLSNVVFFLVYTLTKSYVRDHFSSEEFETIPYCNSENYLQDNDWCSMIKEELLKNFNDDN